MSNDQNQFSLPQLLQPYKNFKDNRGSFKILERLDVPSKSFDFSGEWDGWNYQTNVSVSKPGVLRGMHWQVQFPQAKLVKVLYGKVLDVVVDIRPKSPTFKKVFSFNLTDNGEQLFIPRGFAHGFYNYGETDAVFHYNVDNVYYPVGERGLKWNSIDFIWPIWPIGSEPILSVKDSMHPGINDISLEDFEDIC